MPKTYTFRTLEKALRKHDKRFEVYKKRGKGSERIIYHPDINGRPESYPVTATGKIQKSEKVLLLAQSNAVSI